MYGADNVGSRENGGCYVKALIGVGIGERWEGGW